MKKLRIQKMKGFTLVELLIVITLIAILSVAVLATINPIEQTNKARDAANMNDAAEILNAYERYYTNLQKYPWMNYADALKVDSSGVFASTTVGFGICYGTIAVGSTDSPATCVTAPNFGDLIATDELKQSFANKSMFKTTTATIDRFWTVKATGSNGALNVCFVPKSKSSRTSPNIVAIQGTGTVGTLLQNVSGGFTAPPANDPTLWSTPALDGTLPMYRCVPE